MYTANIENSQGLSETFKNSDYYELMRNVLDNISEHSKINVFGDNRYIAEIYVNNINDLKHSDRYVDFLRQLEDAIKVYNTVKFGCRLVLKV